MQSCKEFIRQSLETHLFFARIMKEHGYFLQVGFVPKDDKKIKEAIEYMNEFDKILIEVIELSKDVISNEVLQSGEIVTQYTLDIERVTERLLGAKINTKITEAEKELCAGNESPPHLEKCVSLLNRKVIKLVENFICFKNHILSEVLSCKIYTSNYSSMIEHFIQEARLYLILIRRYQAREEIHFYKSALDQQIFWNGIMEDHSEFFRGLFDPCEHERIKKAEYFTKEFNRLLCATKEAREVQRCIIFHVVEENLKVVKTFCEFNSKITDSFLKNDIRSIMVPLFSDHTLREVNYYNRLLSIFKYVD